MDRGTHMAPFPSSSVVKTLPANGRETGHAGSVPGSTRSPEVGNGNAFQYSCLVSPIDRRAYWATVYGDAESQTQLND